MSYSSAASLRSLCFHQLAPRHLRHWDGDPTIVDAYVGSFHGKGKALYLNLGPRQRKTLTNGFTAVVDRPVERNTLRACQWKGKHSKRRRLKWRKPGEMLQGRQSVFRVECGEYHATVKSVMMGMAYGFKGGLFEKFYVDRHTVVSYVDEHGGVIMVPIRRGKDTSELMDDCVQIRAIHVQAKRVSQHAISRQVSESEEERLVSDESLTSPSLSSSLSSESAESAESFEDFAGRLLSTSGGEDEHWEAYEGGGLEDVLEHKWNVEELGINKENNKIAFDLKKLTDRMNNKKQIRTLFNRVASRSYKKMMDLLDIMARKKRDIIFGAMAMLSLHEGKGGVFKKNKGTTTSPVGKQN